MPFLYITTNNNIVETERLTELTEQQNAVGGYVEPVAFEVNPLDDELVGGPFMAVAWVNEDGVGLGLIPNRAASAITGRRLVGDVFLTGGTNPNTGESRPLTGAQIATIIDLIAEVVS